MITIIETLTTLQLLTVDTILPTNHNNEFLLPTLEMVEHQPQLNEQEEIFL